MWRKFFLSYAWILSAQSLLANVVKSDTVLVEFKMTDLDYQKSKARTRENLALVGLYKALGGGWN